MNAAAHTGGPVSQSLGLTEVLPGDAASLDAVAQLHMELLGFGPMAGLGTRFVREVCYRAHMDEGVLRVMLARVGEVPAGFVAVTPYSLSFHRSGLRQHVGLAARETLRSIISRPSRLPKLLRALRVLGSRRHEIERPEAELGEVVCIAVRPQFLSQRFQRESGLRLSQLLVQRAAQYLRRAGVEDMRMLVDADNRPVLMLYHLMGAHFKGYQLGGEPMTEVCFDLRNGHLAAEPKVPAAWNAVAAAGSDASDWKAYWEKIEDKQEVFRAEARDHIARLRRLVPVDTRMRTLDFGCGFGFSAEQLAPHVGSVSLWDGAANVRRRARARVAWLPNVEMSDLSEPDAPATRTAFDLITVHSVVQYMSEQELRGWLARWAHMLKPGGRLVLSDLIQPGASAARELIDYLKFSVRAGFLWDALLGGVREFANYFGARSSRPLLQVDEPHLTQWAAEAGLKVEWLAENLSHRRLRRTAVLRHAS
ncbi:MAG TPA: methyltransferase domain-containing protein [Steroidobacteraceae bacterium]|nr:methyltransferase domain-containing protein [Steroidobacteraceae bacterium]